MAKKKKASKAKAKPTPMPKKKPSPAQIAARKAAGKRLAQMRLAKARTADTAADKVATVTERKKDKAARVLKKFSGTAPQSQPRTITAQWF